MDERTGQLGRTGEPDDYGDNRLTYRETEVVLDEGLDGDDQTVVIREEIEQTRTEMADTINEIQDRLNPQTIVEQAKESAKELIEHAKESAQHTAEEAIDHAKQAVHDATIGKVENMVSNVSETVQETGTGIMDLIKSNPVPAALAGIGLGWLYMKRNESRAVRPAQPRSQAISATRYQYSQAGYSPITPRPGASGSFQSGGGQGFPNQIVDRIRENPVPAALAGLSIGYMLMQGQGQGQTQAYQPYSYPVGHQAQSLRQGSEKLTDKVGTMAGQAGEKVGGIASGVGEKAGDVAEGVGSAVSKVGEKAGDVVSGAGDVVGNVASGAGQAVSNVAEGAGYQAERVQSGLERMFNERPLVVGAMAVGAGAFIGLMLPATEQEKQLLGEARDQLVEKVQDVAQQTMEKVGQVAGEVQETAKREAEDTGLIQS